MLTQKKKGKGKERFYFKSIIWSSYVVVFILPTQAAFMVLEYIIKSCCHSSSNKLLEARVTVMTHLHTSHHYFIANFMQTQSSQNFEKNLSTFLQPSFQMWYSWRLDLKKKFKDCWVSPELLDQIVMLYPLGHFIGRLMTLT